MLNRTLRNAFYLYMIGHLCTLNKYATYAGPPESVFNCTTSNQSTDAILIACQSGFHGGLPQNFSLQFYEDNSSRLILQQIFTDPIFLLSGLKTNMRYKAAIASVNAKGKSEDVVLDISTQKEPERQLEVKPGKWKLTFPKDHTYKIPFSNIRLHLFIEVAYLKLQTQIIIDSLRIIECSLHEKRNCRMVAN